MDTPIPTKASQRRLGRNPGKDHWTVPDIFRDPHPVVFFTHRDYQIGLHTHEFIEVNLVTGGTGRHFMEDNEMPTSLGDVFVIPPKVEHGYVNEGKLDVFHILLHPLFIQRNMERLEELPGYLMLFTVEPYFRRHSGFRHGMRLEGDELKIATEIADLLERERDAGDGRTWAVDNLTAYFIIHCCRCYAARGDVGKGNDELEARHPHWRAIRAAMELAAVRRGETPTLDDLARAACMQKNYFCRIFRSATGMTPMEYVLRERIREARRLLREGELSVSEVGSRLGFFDTAHFSKVFSRIAGTTPSRYRLPRGKKDSAS